MATSVLIIQGIKGRVMPNPVDSDTQYNQYYHLDIPDLADGELLDEFNYRRGHLWGLAPTDWQRQRVKMLERELSKRRGKKWQ